MSVVFSWRREGDSPRIKSKLLLITATPTPFGRSGARCGVCRLANPFESSCANKKTTAQCLSSFHGGERGIRTPETSRPAYTLSKRAPSTTRTPLHYVYCKRFTMSFYIKHAWSRRGHVPRPRRNIFANKFARVGSLADCHRQPSPSTTRTPLLVRIIIHTYGNFWKM